MGKLSNTKGSVFEREICKQLSLWLTEGKRDDVFWRTACSGGRATNRAKGNKKTSGGYGDITFLNPAGESLLKLFCFELKCGYSKQKSKGKVISVLSYIDCFGKGKTILELFWEQAIESTEQAGAHFPIVIFKRDLHKVCVMVPKSFLYVAERCFGDHKLSNIQVVFPDRPPAYRTVVICTFESFLDFVNPNSIDLLIRNAIPRAV